MNIILVGIGGIGLSAIGQILYKLGYKNIIGIDSTKSEITEKLKKLGTKIIIGHGKYEVKNDDFVIYSDAAKNSPEVNQAKNKFSYFEFIGEVSKYFKTIAIAGSHGKSTTTALTIYGLKNLYKNNLALGIVGALMPDFENKNYFLNKKLIPEIRTIFSHIITGKFKNFNHNLIKKYRFVIEADEFNKHFLLLDPDYAIITNIDWDHTDIYPKKENYFETFNQFTNLVRYKIITFSDLKDILKPSEKIAFLEKENSGQIKLNYLFGKHNQQNTYLVTNLLKIILNKQENEIINNLKNFKGLRRRLEYIGENKNGAKIFTDYAHHPTEIKAIFSALKENFPNKKIIIIFQPHQARRVIEFFDDFVNILSKFDQKIIYKIYAARENIKNLIEAITQKEKKEKFEKIDNFEKLGKYLANQINGKYINDFEDIKNIIQTAKNDEVILIATAGDLDYQLRKYLNKI